MKKILLLTVFISSFLIAIPQDSEVIISLQNDPPLDLNIKYNRSFDNYLSEALGNVITLTEETEWSQSFTTTSWSSTFAAAKEQSMQEMMDEVTSGKASDNFNQLVTADYLLERTVVSAKYDESSRRILSFEVTLKLIDVKTGKEKTTSQFLEVRGSTSNEQKESLVFDLTSLTANLFTSYFSREPFLSVQSLNDRAVIPIVKDVTVNGKHGRSISHFLSASIAKESVNNTDLTFEIESSPSNGSIRIGTNNKLVYTPNPGFVGIDSATYFVSYKDNKNGYAIRSNIKMISFYVTNLPPTAKATSVRLQQGSEKTFILKGTDSDNDKLQFELVEDPLRGQLDINNRNPGEVTYIPNQNATGSDSFKFRVFDGVEYSDEVDVKITITSINNLPEADSFEIVTLHDIEHEDFFRGFDKDGDVIKYYVAKDPANGSLKSTKNNKFIYTPKRGFVGSDSFDYLAEDESGSRSNKATVLISVTNKKPVAVSRTYNGPKSDTFTIKLEGLDEDVLDASRLNTKVYKLPFGKLEKVKGTKDQYEYTNTKNRKEDDIIFYVFDGVENSDYAQVTLILNQNNSVQPNSTVVTKKPSVNNKKSKEKKQSIPAITTVIVSKPRNVPTAVVSEKTDDDDEGGMNMGLILGVLLLLVLAAAGGGGGGGGSDPTGGVDIGVTIP